MEGTPEEIFKRADELTALGLGLPPAVKLSMLLRERGIEMPENILSEEEIVDYLKDLKKERRV